jgi:hypothetical protein
VPAERPLGPESNAFCRDYAPYHRAQPDDTPLLEHYIRRAEKLCFGEVISGSPIFSTSWQGYNLPVLQKGTWNRILVFAGCFSPPHLGHLELLAHIFLRTDKCAIAAMLVPCFDATGGKDAAMVKGQELSLSKDQRSVLLQDKLMTRFSWIYRRDHTSTEKFQRQMVRLAAADRYHLSFTDLEGSDHFQLGEEVSGWGDGNLVTSDVTRPSCFIRGARTKPVLLKGCGQWTKIPPLIFKGRKWCWPCYKFQKICPEFSEQHISTGKRSTKPCMSHNGYLM